MRNSELLPTVSNGNGAAMALAPEGRSEVSRAARWLVHEIRNPLNAMRIQAVVIHSKLRRPDEANLRVAREQLTRLEHELNRLEMLAHAFLEWGRPPRARPDLFRLSEVIEEVAELVRPEVQRRAARLVLRPRRQAGELCVCMDRAQFHQVVWNLLTNAEQAIPRNGEIMIAYGRRRSGEAVLHVADDGFGIPQHAMPHIFEPFYSTRPDGEGLGLNIAQRIIEGAGGNIRCRSRPGRGTIFSITLPIQPAPVANGPLNGSPAQERPS